MRAQDQAQPSPTPSPPQSPHPVPPPQLVEHPHSQFSETTCPICLNNIQSNEAVINCTTCHNPYHYGELIQWLTIRRNRGEAEDCPTCRGDMQPVLDNQQPMVAPAIILPQPPPNFNNSTPPGLQPAELLDNINNWNWNEPL
ncbi:unnamed protein product [Adineta steineri]|uniref:RING-type domain-containing protein n=1 Tax=Adineta steineri TaxID=433720 RepID=A0A819QVC7_9BILA|nr:unnamed protein product [Adineta steineri]CAF4037723.1 unnamed protein product [Adineta steineri]